MKIFRAKLNLLIVIILCFFLLIPCHTFGWAGVGSYSGDLSYSNSSGHGKITSDAFNDSDAATFKSYMNAQGKQNTLLLYVAAADVAAEKAWVAQLDDTGNPLCPIAINIRENETNNSVIHMAAHAVTDLKRDIRMNNAIELLRLAIYWKEQGQNPELQFRLLGNGLHLLQDYFAHLNAGRESGHPHGINSSLKVDNNGDGIPETPVGDGNVMDSLNWDNHSDHSSGIPYDLRSSDAFNLSFWHKDTNWNNNYRYKQAKEMSIKYMNAFMSGTEANFVRALEQGYVVNGSTTVYIDYISKCIIDNTDTYCTFDSEWASSSSGNGYWGSNYAFDGTPGADSSARWAKFTTPEYEDSWYNFKPGKYEIYMRWTAGADRPDAAPLEIKYDGGIDTSKTVNQQINGGQWNYIGTYNLAESGNYVKIFATDSGYTVADAVMFKMAAESYNIENVTVSSSHEGKGWSYSFVHDGQRSSMSGSNGWSSGSSTGVNHTEWIKFDLGSSKLIGSIDLYPRNDGENTGSCFPIDFDIQVSADDVNWTTIVSKTNYPKPKNTAQGFTFTPVYARYVKIIGTNLRPDQYGAYRMQFAEVEINSRENYAYGKNVTVSSSHEGVGWSYSKVNDGERSSLLSTSMGWSSGSMTSQNHTEWIMIDLDSIKTIYQVDLYPRNDGANTGYCFPVDFTIEVSTDSVNWETVVEANGYTFPGNHVQTFFFDSIPARYVKINATNLRTDNYGAYRLQFAEIEIY